MSEFRVARRRRLARRSAPPAVKTAVVLRRVLSAGLTGRARSTTLPEMTAASACNCSHPQPLPSSWSVKVATDPDLERQELPPPLSDGGVGGLPVRECEPIPEDRH